MWEKRAGIICRAKKIKGGFDVKKITRIFIVILAGIMMLCVWPICLIRKAANIDSALGIEYGVTEAFIAENQPYEQFFIAQTEKLNGIAFVVEYQEELPKDGTVHFDLSDKNGYIFFSRDIAFEEIGNKSFCMVTVNKWLKKGQEYSYRLSVEKKYEGFLRGVYTRQTDEHAKGSLQLRIGNDTVEGQGLARYEYGTPLNIKNVVCLWAFILTIAVSAFQLTIGEHGEDEKSANQR